MTTADFRAGVQEKIDVATIHVAAPTAQNPIGPTCCITIPTAESMMSQMFAHKRFT
jgi:hypothetical protein